MCPAAVCVFFGVVRGRLKTVVTVSATLGLLIKFTALGGLLFMWLDERTFMEAFYFCFITTTTIGFGDIVPRECSMSLRLGVGAMRGA